MRVTLFDGLLEHHVSLSLERALTMRGHAVYNTGRIGRGPHFETDPLRLTRLHEAIDRTIDFQPDLILVFRPSSLPPSLLRRIRASNAHLAVWLSDDPVLWNFSYRVAVENYDTVLNCGTERVLKLYDDHLGRPVGINFPFWTDSTAFPYVYNDKDAESDALFLGNVHDPVRRRRYFELGASKANIRIHGKVGNDFYSLGGGYLDSDLEIVGAASRARVAVSIPQRFTEHYGRPTWFSELSELGAFQYPSRVIQCAAMGLPIISIGQAPSDLDTFPELVSIAGYRELAHTIEELKSGTDLASISQRTHIRFLRHFSADSRAAALESVLTDDSWRSLPAAERARWFTRFEGNVQAPSSHSGHLAFANNAAIALTCEGSACEESEPNDAPWEQGLHIVLAGPRGDSPTSPTSVARRALARLGHQVTPLAPSTHPTAFSEHASSSPTATIDPEALFEEVGTRPDVLLLIGHDYLLTDSGKAYLDKAGVLLVYHAVGPDASPADRQRIARHAHAASFSSSMTTHALKSRGFRQVCTTVPLVDADYRDLVAGGITRRPEVRVVGARRTDLADFPHLREDLRRLGARFATEDVRADGDATLQDVAEHLSSAVTVVAHERSGEQEHIHELTPFALASGGLVVFARTPATSSIGEPGVSHMLAQDPYELSRKLIRLRSDILACEAYLTRAQQLSQTDFSAERKMSELMRIGTAAREEQRQVRHPDLVCKAMSPKCGPASIKTWKLRIPQSRAASVIINLARASVIDYADTTAFQLEFLVDNDVVAVGKLQAIPDACQTSLSFPAGMPRSKVAVRLNVIHSPGTFNWSATTGLSCDMQESAHVDAPRFFEFGSNAPCFKTP